LSLSELKREVEERYRDLVGQGVEVTPVLLSRAPRYVYVLGEVVTPGRFSLEGPTTLMQAVALAGGWKIGGNLREIVVFRRKDDWRLMATKLDLRGALFGERPCPPDEIWLRDSDIVIVPKNHLQRADDLIELVFTRGLYGILPFTASVSQASAL
jgi:polysaccharide export outer membrane protein